MDTAQYQLNAEVEERHWWFVARRRIMRDLIRAVLPPGPDAQVVDVGCGTGGNIIALADAYPAIGVDSAESAIALARERGPSVRFVSGRAPDAIAADIATTRLFLLMDVLEHVPDDFALLTGLLTGSNPGTLFLITVPADPEIWSGHDVSHGHYRRYTIERFQRLWRDLPVEPLLVSHFNARLYSLVRFLRRRNRRRGRTYGRAGTDLRMPSAPVNRALRWIFAGERKRLLRRLGNGRTPAYRDGVSLIAVLRRGDGAIGVHSRPDDVEPDVHGPGLDGTVE